MKTLNKILAAVIATASIGNAIALPEVSVINTRVDNILLKIGVDSAGFNSGDYSITGTNDLGDFSSNFTAGSGATAQTIADQINAFNIVNSTVYVPTSIDSVNGVRSDGLEDMLLNALAFKIDELTGDVGSLTNSFAAGKLAFETALNDGSAIIAPSSVDYSNADAQTWFGVKNSLDIFTASANAWTAGIRELNGDMNNDGVRDTGRVSHFDADVVVGAEVAVYAADQDVTTDVGITVSTFANDGTESSVFLDLGTSYDRDSLAAASIAAGSTAASERNGILSGETIFSTARHFTDTTGYAGAIVNSFDAASLTTTVNTPGTNLVYTASNNWYWEELVSGTFTLFDAAGVDQSTTRTTAEMDADIAASSDTGTFIVVSSTSSVWDGVTLKWDGFNWAKIDGSGSSISTTVVNAAGEFLDPTGTVITGVIGDTFAEYNAFVTTAAIAGVSEITLNAGALDMIKNSEIKGYVSDFLTDSVTLSSPQWLQDL